MRDVMSIIIDKLDSIMWLMLHGFDALDSFSQQQKCKWWMWDDINMYCNHEWEEEWNENLQKFQREFCCCDIFITHFYFKRTNNLESLQSIFSKGKMSEQQLINSYNSPITI